MVIWMRQMLFVKLNNRGKNPLNASRRANCFALAVHAEENNNEAIPMTRVIQVLDQNGDPTQPQPQETEVVPNLASSADEEDTE